MKSLLLTTIFTLTCLLLSGQSNGTMPQRAAIPIGSPLHVFDSTTVTHTRVGLSLGSFIHPGPHPSMHLLAPCPPFDSAGQLLLAPTLGQSRIFVSNIGSSGIDGVTIGLDTMPFGVPDVAIAPVRMQLVTGWPGHVDGAVIMRPSPVRDHLTISNIGSSGLDGVSIELGDDLDLLAPRASMQFWSPTFGSPSPPEIRLHPDINAPGISLIPPPPFIVPLPGISIGLAMQDSSFFPQIQLLRDPLFPPADQVRIAVSDTTPGLVLRDVTAPDEIAIDLIHVPELFISGLGTEFIGVRFGVKEDPISGDTVPRVEIRPTSTGDHLTISNIGSSGQDGVSIDLGDPLDLTFTGPAMQLIQPNTSDPVITFRPNIFSPHFQMSSLGLAGAELSLGQTFSSACIGCVPAIRLHTPILGQPETTGGITLQAGIVKASMLSDGGRLTVSNIGSSGEDGVSLDLTNGALPSTTTRLIHDTGLLHSMIIAGPERYVHDPGLGLETEWFYDHIDRRIRVIRYDGPDTLSHSYDPSGRRIDVTGVDTTTKSSTGGLLTIQQFDNLSRVVEDVRKDGADEIVFQYDPAGRRLESSGVDTAIHHSSVGLTTRTIYDGINRRITRSNEDGPIFIEEGFSFLSSEYDLLGADIFRHTTSSDYVYIRVFNAPSRTMTTRHSDLLSGESMERLYDPNAHSVSHLLHNRYSYSSPQSMYCISEFDDLTRLYTETFSDSNSVTSLRCDYDPNGQLMRCTSDGGLVSRYTYDNANRIIGRDYEDGPTLMRCEYDLVTKSMSCTDYNSRSYTSSGNMHCASSFDDGARSVSRVYVDNNSLSTMSCHYLPNSQTLQCANVGLRTYSHTSQLLCEYDSRGLLGQTVSETYSDQGTGSSVRLLYDPNNVLILGSGVPAPSVTVDNGLGGNAHLLVSGDLHTNGVLSKAAGAFKIDHPQDPENKYLVHSFVESPDMMNVYNGNVVTDTDGYATVVLPDYFEVLNIDFRYQLTVMGQFAQAIVKEKITNNSFVIQTDKPEVEVSWQVTGVRNDDYARENRLQVEVDKPEDQKGTRLYFPKEPVGLED